MPIHIRKKIIKIKVVDNFSREEHITNEKTNLQIAEIKAS